MAVSAFKRRMTGQISGGLQQNTAAFNGGGGINSAKEMRRITVFWLVTNTRGWADTKAGKDWIHCNRMGAGIMAVWQVALVKQLRMSEDKMGDDDEVDSDIFG